jgi:outer membrane receptor for ferrienterochelin and colicins
VTRNKSWLLVAAIGAFWSQTAQADDASELEALLDQKVITAASKSAETTDSAPATVVTLTAEDIRRYGFRTVAEAIRFLVPGAILEEQPGGSFGSRAVLLPFDFGSHVLVLVDGHSINNEVDGSADLGSALGVPIELVDHVEVVLGPGSVLYGTNAMFGVVNVVTKSARNYRKLKLTLDAEFSRQYRAAAGAGSEFTLFGSRGEFMFALEHIEMHDPLAITREYVGNDVYTGVPLRTRSDGTSGGVWGGTWNNNLSRVTAGYGKVSLGRFQLAIRAGHDRTNDPTSPFDFDAADLGYHDRWLSLDLQFRQRISEPLELRLRLYGDELRRDVRWRSSAAQYCLPGQFDGCVSESRGGAEGLGLDAQARIDWVGNGTQSTLVGVDGRIRNVQYVSDLTNARTGANPGSTAYYSEVDPILGAYAQHVAGFGRHVTLNLGSRLDVHPDTKAALSPRAALVYRAWPGSTLKAIYSSAFQAPLPATLAFAQPLLVVPPDHLTNERVRAFELTYEQRFATQTLHTGLFYSRWTDMVELVQLSATELDRAKAEGRLLSFIPRAYQYRNAAAIESYGITSQWEGSLVDLRLRYALSFTEAFSRARRSQGADEELGGSPALMIRARVSYELGEPWPTLGVSSIFSGRVLAYNIDAGGYSPPATVDPRLVLLGNVSGPVPALLPGLRYRLGLRFATGAESAYAIGAVRAATPENPTPVLFPLRRFTLLAGLEYSFE